MNSLNGGETVYAGDWTPSKRAYVACGTCSAPVIVPDVLVRNTGLLVCSSGHYFNRRAAVSCSLSLIAGLRLEVIP